MRLDRLGEMGGGGDAGNPGNLACCSNIKFVWNYILPRFRHWGLLPDWREDWLMERGDRGSWDFAWPLFLSLQAEG